MEQTPSRVRLPVGPALLEFSETVHGRGMDDQHCAASLHAVDSLITKGRL